MEHLQTGSTALRRHPDHHDEAGDPHTYVVVVRNLYGAMQVIVSEEVLDVQSG